MMTAIETLKKPLPASCVLPLLLVSRPMPSLERRLNPAPIQKFWRPITINLSRRRNSILGSNTLSPAATASSFLFSSRQPRTSRSTLRRRKTRSSSVNPLSPANNATTIPASSTVSDAPRVGDGSCSFPLARLPRAWSLGFPCGDLFLCPSHRHPLFKSPKISRLLNRPLPRVPLSPLHAKARKGEKTKPLVELLAPFRRTVINRPRSLLIRLR